MEHSLDEFMMVWGVSSINLKGVTFFHLYIAFNNCPTVVAETHFASRKVGIIATQICIMLRWHVQF